MTAIVLVVTSFTLIFFAVQAAMALKFFKALQNWKRHLIADDECPETTVILCLRGRDPFLEDCLEGILNQDYPCYEVRAVIDHEDDPAHDVVRRFLERPAAVKMNVSLLTNRRESCSLKCSSLIEAVDQLEEDCEVIALLDADTVPHSTWLRELVTPLQCEGVGAATGNRWYVPATTSLGATTRYLWNAFAIVQMGPFSHSLGGSLALKTTAVRDAALSDFWGKAFCEDTMLYRILKQQGLRIAFVPSVLMANRENCEVEDFYWWIQRQLLTVRLYHPAWLGVAAHGFLTGALPVCLSMILVASMAAPSWEAVLSIAGLVAAYGLAMGGLLLAMEVRIRRIFEARGERVEWVDFPALLKAPVAVLLLQALYPGALTAAMFLRKTTWRGINYRIKGPWNIRRLDYEPFVSGSEKTDESL